jgi:hypothetical protein
MFVGIFCLSDAAKVLQRIAPVVPGNRVDSGQVTLDCKRSVCCNKGFFITVEHDEDPCPVGLDEPVQGGNIQGKCPVSSIECFCIFSCIGKIDTLRVQGTG